MSRKHRALVASVEVFGLANVAYAELFIVAALDIRLPSADYELSDTGGPTRFNASLSDRPLSDQYPPIAVVEEVSEAAVDQMRLGQCLDAYQRQAVAPVIVVGSTENWIVSEL